MLGWELTLPAGAGGGGVGTVAKGIDPMSKRKHKENESLESEELDATPDYQTECIVCGSVPTLPLTGMCGPCTFGEADTANGEW